jgi:hypothetical protein
MATIMASDLHRAVAFSIFLSVCFLTSSVLSIISIILIRKGVSPAGSVISFLHHMDAGVVPAQLHG